MPCIHFDDLMPSSGWLHGLLYLLLGGAQDTFAVQAGAGAARPASASVRCQLPSEDWVLLTAERWESVYRQKQPVVLRQPTGASSPWQEWSAASVEETLSAAGEHGLVCACLHGLW
eukprot:SAG11_NODE_3984_length_2121_cov_1.696340_3_plen_116_part_00